MGARFRRWSRPLAGTVAVAACLFAAQTAIGATITVTTTAEDPAAAETGCSLREAIIAANRASPRGGCTAGDAGATNTIILQTGAVYALSQPDQPEAARRDRASWYGPNGLPPIASTIVIDGNGATISRSPGVPPFRLFYVGADPAAAATSHYITPGAGN